MRTRVFNGKEQIFCELRHRWVRLTPEEWVRQQLLHRLVEQLHYPASLIAVEVPLQLPITNHQLTQSVIAPMRSCMIAPCSR